MQNEVAVETSGFFSTTDGTMLAEDRQVGNVVALEAAEDSYHPEETCEEAAIQQPNNEDQHEANIQGSTIGHFSCL